MVTAGDVDKLAPIVHGVNVKLEKAGGLRGALHAIDRAKQRDIKVSAKGHDCTWIWCV
jgi:L-alanine-DL-glutamate epimerase-like enolase superfamily enzyme